MATERKALVVTHSPGATDAVDAGATVDALTAHLNDGWRLLSTTAMGGTGGADAVLFACLVVLEREKETAVAGFSSR